MTAHRRREPAGERAGPGPAGRRHEEPVPARCRRSSRPRPPNMTGAKCVVSAPSLEQLGDDLGISGAADVEQQARVVGLGRRLRVDAQTLGEPHRDQRCCADRARTADRAEIRRQAECCDQLGGADLIRGPARYRLARRDGTAAPYAGVSARSGDGLYPRAVR